ncbi:coiled-coil domain-containing protein 73 [Eudromia elegans]
MDEDSKTKALDSTLSSPSETLLSIQLLNFKTNLLEAIEELRIRRETEIHYEDQISKIVVEKQELEWQKEALQHQTDTLHQQNKEAVAVFKKQLQARMFAMEEEKGKYQLAIETKEKEIDGLKEALKALQISKYTLQKKLNEMDQKLKVHLTAKGEHQKKLNEIEKCYATIAHQLGVVKGVHGKLEHSVQEAVQLNKILTSVNKRQETEIINLKEELKKVTTDLIRSKVTSQYRVGEENINLAAKEKEFQELQQKIRMEVEVSKKLQEENAHIKEEKQEIISSLQRMQELLQRITQTNVRMEDEFKSLKEDYQTLERDNELQREKAKENEEKFLNLQNEHEKALRTWKKDEENMRKEIDAMKNELNSLKGVSGPLEDYHSSQGNQCSEQAENLQFYKFLKTVARMKTILPALTKKNKGRPLPGRIPLAQEKKAGLEHKLLDSTDLAAALPTGTGKAFLEGIDIAGVYQKAPSQETNSSKPELGSAADQVACSNTDKKTCPLQCTKSTLVPGAASEESGKALGPEENTGPDRSAGSPQAKELNIGILSYTKENDQAEYQDCSLLDSDSCVENRPKEAEKKKLSLSDLYIDKFLCKQKPVDIEERNCNDSARNISRNAALLSGFPAANAANLPTLYCDTASGDDILEEHSANRPLRGTFNLSAKADRGVSVNDMQSNQPEQASAEQTGNDMNKCALNVENVSTVNADDLEIILDKETSKDRSSTDDLIPSVNINTDTKKESIKNEHSLESNDNSVNKALLKEKKDSLSSTVPGSKLAEGHLTESCSSPRRTSGNLVNLSGRSSFDLSTSSKKAEKTPVHFKFLDLGSCSRVNQIRSQTMWTSASKEPSLLKEKLPALAESRKGISETQCQNIGESVIRKEMHLVGLLPCLETKLQLLPFPFCQSGSPSFNRAADTLNICSIHQAPQGDPREEWNAAAKAFYDSSFPTEHVSQLKILQTRPQKISQFEPLFLNDITLVTAKFVFYQVEEGFDVSKHEQKSSRMAVTPVSDSALREEERCSMQKFNIKSHIEEIEKFLNLERLHSSRKRKYEES